MHRTGSGITLGAGKPRPLGEVQIQVQALAIGTELGAHHPPRLGQAKSSLEQVNLRHRQSSPTVKGRTLTLPAPGHHYPHDSARSQIVLACAAGTPNTQVAAELGVHPDTVSKWRNRFITGRLDGLIDEDRPGRPPSITVEQVEAVVVATLEETPRNATHWSRKQ